MKTMLFRSAAVMAFVLVCQPGRALAWNYVGHELIARIAWEQMTPEARLQARLIIRQHPALHADLLKDMPADFGDRDLYAFLVAATWPDVIRANNNPWHAKYHHSEWHYINVPYILAGTDSTKLHGTEQGLIDWKPGEPVTDLVQALAKCEYDLRDPNLPGSDKAIALSWYLHLAGDAHQPLHANTLFSDQFPGGDRGGNNSAVRNSVLTTQPSLISPQEYLTPAGEDLIHTGVAAAPKSPATLPSVTTLSPMNLHFFWDNIFGRLAPPKVIDALFTELTTEYPPASLRQQAANLQYSAWVDESFDFAVRDAHRNGTLQTGTLEESRSHPELLPTLPADYLSRAQEVCRLRMTTAGYRIANELNTIFAAK